MIITGPKSRRLKRFTAGLAQGLGHLLWPATCMSCRQNPVDTGGQLCSRCWEQIISLCGPGYCRRCGRDASPYALCDGVCAACRDENIHFDEIARAGAYADALKQSILAFKHGQTELDKVLGGLINSALQAGPFANEVEMFVPVPLHWFRRLNRGYNQSAILTRLLKHPAVKNRDDLVRIRYTKPQPAMQTNAARAKNVSGAFAVRRRHPFEARKICLVDDIKTTGATLNECARILKEAGAHKVFALVLAVAGQAKL